MKNIIEILRHNNILLIGCTEMEIAELEGKVNLNLPQAYSEILLNFGKEAKGFMTGSLCYFDDLELIKTESRLLLQENNFRTLPEKAFVFWMHQGYQFAFFICDQGGNPPVYYYNETNRQIDFVKTYDSITDFYLDEIKNSNMEVPKFL